MIIEVGRSCIVMNRIKGLAILASFQNTDNQKLTWGGSLSENQKNVLRLEKNPHYNYKKARILNVNDIFCQKTSINSHFLNCNLILGQTGGHLTSRFFGYKGVIIRAG